MVVSIVFATTVYPAQLTTFKTMRNVAIVPNITASLNESSFSRHHSSNTKEYQLQHGVQKIRGIMTGKRRGYVGLEELIMVDVIQRFGLEDYFREEIHGALERLRAKYLNLEDGDDKFYEVSLSFRLLRQNGYHVPADIFNNFKDKDGKFKQEVCKDVKALLSLFESSHLSTPGEDILGEANDISGQLLKASLNNMVEQSKARIIIENTLRNPYHKSLSRLLVQNFLHDFNDVSLNFLHDFNNVKEWLNEVQELARIDFDMTQMTYRNEVQQISM